MKVCPKCGEEKSRAEFSRSSCEKDGLQYHCKACDAAYRLAHREEKHAYNAEHRSEIAARRAAYHAAYYAEHREERAAYSVAYRAAHREKIAAYKAVYNAEHREEIAARQAIYNAEHLDQYAACSRNRKARKKGNGGTHTVEDIQTQYDRQKGKCFWCNVKLGKKRGEDYHPDHVTPLALGGSNGPENLVIACPPCNLTKSAKHPMDFCGRLL